MSDMIRCDDVQLPRRSIVRFHDEIHIATCGSGVSDRDECNHSIDIEAPVFPHNEKSHSVAASSDAENDNKNDDDSSHNSDSTKSAQNHHDWMMFLFQSYASITLLMASGGAILSKIISYLCPSRAQINEDDLVAITGLANGDKAFLFVGSDGGSSYISYVSNLYDCIIA